MQFDLFRNAPQRQKSSPRRSACSVPPSGSRRRPLQLQWEASLSDGGASISDGDLSKIGNVTSLASLRLPLIQAITNPHKIAWMKPLGSNGPLNVTIGDLRRNFSRQSQLQRAARQDETVWDQAMKHMQAAEFDDAEKLLRELIASPEAGQPAPTRNAMSTR